VRAVLDAPGGVPATAPPAALGMKGHLEVEDESH